MKLDDNQIQYVREYIDAFDIKYYELREEFLDHLILRVEEKMQETDVPFIRAVMDAKEEFGTGGFKKIMIEREKYLTNQYKLQYQKIVRSYLKFPQAVGSVLLTALLFGMGQIVPNPVKALTILVAATITLSLLEIAVSFKYRQVSHQPLLQVSVFFKTLGLAIIMSNICVFLNVFFKDANLNSPLLIAVYSVIGTVSIICFLAYRKLRQQVMSNVKRLYFS